MTDILIFIALMMSLATGILAVWVFNYLVSGGAIVGDKYNEIELWLAISITALVLVALIGFTIRKLRG